MRNSILEKKMNGGSILMEKYLDKFQAILGGIMKLMYRVFGIFGVVSKDDTTGEQLADAFKQFAEDIKG